MNGRRLARRAGGCVITLWVLITVTFGALHLLGNPVLRMLGEDPTPEQIESLSRTYGYDRPFLVQYVDFVRGVLTGQFGDSLQYGRPALDVVLDRAPATMLLAVVGMLGGVLLGSGAGWLAVFGSRRLGARLPLALLTAIQAFPAFFKAIVLMLIFSVSLGLFPIGGFETWGSLVLPASTLALATAPAIGRVYRTSLVGAERAPHVETAVAKGLPRHRVRASHIQRNALLPVTTIIGLQFATLLSGALVVEQVFSWPGIGQLTFQAISGQDYPVVLASTFVIGIVFIVVTALTDEVNRLIDPRTEAAR